MNQVQLSKEIEEKRANWNERSQFVIAGVKNLSPADLDTIELYMDYHNKGWGHQLMKPLGAVANVLEKANINPGDFGSRW